MSAQSMPKVELSKVERQLTAPPLVCARERDASHIPATHLKELHSQWFSTLKMSMDDAAYMLQVLSLGAQYGTVRKLQDCVTQRA